MRELAGAETQGGVCVAGAQCEGDRSGMRKSSSQDKYGITRECQRESGFYFTPTEEFVLKRGFPVTLWKTSTINSVLR